MTTPLPKEPGPIGIFDSGYGGLTILHEIRQLMPQYDYLYLGDNARTPYGTRSFEIVYEFTLEAVEKLFNMGCHLVILACNTASAKALKSIQLNDLPRLDPSRKVLGVIRPTAECIDKLTHTRHVGVLATAGTIKSESYPIEIHKLYPDITVTGEACPMWVPLVENYEFDSPGAIDTIILGCTHYPLLINKIIKYTPRNIKLVPQGEYVAYSLKSYLERHKEVDGMCTKKGTCRFLTTESPEKFKESASVFLRKNIEAERITLE